MGLIMEEELKLSLKEICHEIILRKKGKKGEWDFNDATLAHLFYCWNILRMPMALYRPATNIPFAKEEKKND